MRSRLDFIKTTVVRGFVFLVPIVVVIIALGKVFGFLKTMAKALAPLFGIESLAGGIALDVLAIAFTALLCFATGLLARGANARRIRAKLDTTLLANLPGYAFVKGMVENLRHSEELAATFVPVMVRFDDYAQIAFETQRDSDGRVAIYLPGAPNPWSGSVLYVSADRVQSLPITLTEAIRKIRSLGKGEFKGSVQIVEPKPSL